MSLLQSLVEGARRGGTAAEIELRQAVVRCLETGRSGHEQVLAFLAAAGPREWLTLDQAMRAAWYEEEREPPWWRRLASALRGPRDEPPALLAAGLASMKRDGRTREAAVRLLAAEPNPLAARFLALRTTDWVEPVAAAARARLGERLSREPALAIAVGPLAFALELRQRASDLGRLVRAHAAADPEVRGALLRSSDRDTRRRLLADERVRAAIEPDELVRLATCDADTLVASGAGVEAVRRLGSKPETSTRLGELLAGPAPVRCAVLRALAERGQGTELAERHLFDRSPGVRAAAQELHRRAGGDPAAAYRASLDNAWRVPIALSELADTGLASDQQALLDGLRSTRSAVRRAAASALQCLTAAELRAHLAPLLGDPSPAVVRTVERRLRAQAGDLDGARLFELALLGAPHQRRAAQRLLRRRTTAERLEADLLALADARQNLRADGLSDLSTWLAHGAASAPRADLATRRRLAERLAAVERGLGPEQAELLRFHAGLRARDLDSGPEALDVEE